MLLTLIIGLSISIQLGYFFPMGNSTFALTRYDGANNAWRSKGSERKWQAAIYRGLQVGKSLRKDLLRELGKPRTISPEADSNPSNPDRPIAYQYFNRAGIKGTLNVIVGKKSYKILRITLYPRRLSKEQAIQVFGSDYIISRYDFCEGIEDTTAPIYLSQEGQMLCLEYPTLGISLSLDDDNQVTEINYLSDPPGLTSKKDCPNPN